MGRLVTLPGLILLRSYQILSYMHAPSTPPKPTRYFVGLDVYRDTIATCVHVSVARRPCYETEFCAQTPIKSTRFVDLVHRRFGGFRACYEASFCGYILYKDLAARGIGCAVIAPGSIPRRSCDRIKNDQRDARKSVNNAASHLRLILPAGLIWRPVEEYDGKTMDCCVAFGDVIRLATNLQVFVIIRSQQAA